MFFGSPRYLWLAVVPVILTAGACSEPPEREAEVEIMEALAFEPLGRGQRATLDTTEIAIRDLASWTVYQDSLHPLQPFATVNFDQEMVLLAAVPVPSGGYGVEFESVEKTSEGLTARYLLTVPGFDCMTTMAEAVVFQAVRLARSDAGVRFERMRENYPCTTR